MSTKPRKDTRVDLVIELEALPNRTPLVQRIIDEARAGEFHDFKNKKYVEGKIVLVGLLAEAGLTDLRTRVIDGEFDEVADDEDIAELRSSLPAELRGLFGL